jgi:hypothetical protein
MSLKIYTIAALISLSVLGCSKSEPNVIPTENNTVDMLRLNQFQVIGSHNSYRLRTLDQIFDSLLTIADNLPENPLELDYTHETIWDQLETYGIRQFELDIYHDPDGGRFYNQMGLEFILGQDPESGIDELLEPGMKLLHIPDIDYRTHHYTFIGALEAIRNWSVANPSHFPIMILVEAKTTTLLDNIPWLEFTETLPFDVPALDAIDDEIRSVFGESLERVLTPEDVRGIAPTLNQAIIDNGWPRLASLRGKVMFCFNNGGEDAQNYISGHPNLDGRIMFANVDPGTDESAFLMFNESTDNFSQWINQGYLVRTRADVGTWEARDGDYSRMDAAFESGAQWISTDYYRPDPRHVSDPDWTDFEVRFDEGAIRVNPVLVDHEVTGEIEDL